MIPSNAQLHHEYSVIDVEGNSDTLTNARIWCEQVFGPQGVRWFFTYKRFYFKNEKDAAWFELRW